MSSDANGADAPQPPRLYVWEVTWQSRDYEVTAVDYEPDEGGVSFIGKAEDDGNAWTVAYFTFPVAIVRGPPTEPAAQVPEWVPE